MPPHDRLLDRIRWPFRGRYGRQPYPDILVQCRRNRRTEERFFCRLLKGHGREPRGLVTDNLRSDGVAHRTIMPTVNHLNHVYANNRAEVSHQPPRQREHAMGEYPADSSSTFSHDARTHAESLSCWPAPVTGGELSFVACSGVSGLEGGRLRIRNDATTLRMRHSSISWR